MADMGAFSLGGHLQSLAKAIEDHGKILDGASVALQLKIGSSSGSLAGAISSSSERLVASLNNASDAAREAAAASERYARRLVWATWALVLATVVLATVTVWHG